jgi:hypothetical protein
MFGHIQQHDGRWCIVDLVGKYGRARTVPMPTWKKVAIAVWAPAASITGAPVFRPVNRGDHAHAAPFNEKVIWQLLRLYAATAGVPGIALMTVVAMPNAGLCRIRRLRMVRKAVEWDADRGWPRE